MNALNPHEGHRSRMREKIRKTGIDSFADHELLEFLLYYCYPRGDTNVIAHRMIKTFGSLYNLFDADLDTLQEKLGCTEKVATLLTIIPAIAARHYKSKWDINNLVLDNHTIASKYALNLFVDSIVEYFYVLCLDSAMKLINTVLISKGSLGEAAVYKREVVKAALDNHATNLILVHNHPGGTNRASMSDFDTTTNLGKVLKIIDVEILDHIIVAGNKTFSFAGNKVGSVVGY